MAACPSTENTIARRLGLAFEAKIYSNSSCTGSANKFNFLAPACCNNT
jgi:hypothetical protein